MRPNNVWSLERNIHHTAGSACDLEDYGSDESLTHDPGQTAGRQIFPCFGQAVMQNCFLIRGKPIFGHGANSRTPSEHPNPTKLD